VGARVLQPGTRYAWLRAFALSGFWLLLLVGLLGHLQAWPHVSDWQSLARPTSVAAIASFILLFIAVTVVRARRWHLLLRPHCDCSWSETWPIFFWTFLLKSLTPLRTGEVVRALWLRRRGGGRLGFGLATVAIERALDLLILLGFGAVVALAGTTGLSSATLTAGLALAVASGLVLSAPMVLPAITSRVRTRWHHSRGTPGKSLGSLVRAMSVRVCATVDTTAQQLESLQDRALAIRALALTLAIWAGLALGYTLVFALLLPSAGMPAAIATLIAVNLVGVLAAPPGNIGTYEVAGLGALAAVGVDPAEALPAIVALHMAVIAASVLAGVIGRVALHGSLDSQFDLY